MGYHVHVYSPDRNTPAGEVSRHEVSAEYDDEEALAEFAKGVDVVTFEFENVPAAVSKVIGQHTLIRPSASVLDICQNRLREKNALQDAGLPVPVFRRVTTLNELVTAIGDICPCVIKTASSGYDGKGQAVIRNVAQAADVWNSLNTDEAIVEQFVEFEREISVVGARNCLGEFAVYRPFQNSHENHILDVTLCPAPLSEPVESRAIEIARTVFEELAVTGVLCVELFVTSNGELLVNELAPRPHNSGHLTIDAHVTCQFEQQVRAICGLPLGTTRQISPAAMANILGDLWHSTEPRWQSVCDQPGCHLHLYGKAEARAGRKMGHMTVLAESTAVAAEQVLTARRKLTEEQATFT